MDEHCSNGSKKFNKSSNLGMLHGETYIVKQIIEKAVDELKKDFDEEYGGFGKIPKYPMPHSLYLLLEYYKVTNNKSILKIIEKTLLNMYKGGFFDHIGYGFFRYSTNKNWLVPSFQKTIQDNALLSMVYASTYEITRKEIYKEIAEKVITYVLRDMTSEESMFYSADGEKNVCEVASIGGINTDFYTWSIEDVERALGKEDGKVYCKYYNIARKGNVNDKSIPSLIYTDLNKIQDNRELRKKLNCLNWKLYLYRKERELPKKNYRISTFKNGLMITALAYVGRLLNNKGYINEGNEAMNSVFKNLLREDGRLLTSTEENKNQYLAKVDDYATFIWSAIELYKSTDDEEYLSTALRLNKDLVKYFWCEEDGSFLIFGRDERLCRKETSSEYEEETYMGNSIAALNMVQLKKITNDDEIDITIKKQLKAFENRLVKNPNHYTFFIAALINMLIKTG